MTENPDFIVRHLYANVCAGGYGSNQQKMDCANQMFTESDNYPIPVINSEYNFDWGNKDLLSQPITATWTALALINQIKNNYEMELFYSGTSNEPNRAYGMWGSTGNKFPIYNMKKIFTSINPKGSSIYKDKISNADFDVLAVNKQYITIINKKGTSNNLNLEIINSNKFKLKDLNTSIEIFISNITNLNFNAFEVKFFELI